MTGKHVRVPFFLSICAVQLALAGCGDGGGHDGPPRSIDITATDERFDPSQIKAHPGEELTITLHNKGKKEHSIEFDLPGLNANEALGRNVPPGKSANMSLKAPSKTGTYNFFSPVGDDRKRGLEGRLDVESTPTTTKR